MFPGTAYCTAFNDAEQLAELDSILRSAPYDAPPVAPVLYIKGGHCLVPSGSVVAIPEPYWRLSIGASVAVQRTVTGFDTVRPAIDLSIPHESFFRPAIGEMARDGFLVLGDAQPWPDNFDSAEIVTEIQRTIVHRWSLTQLVRPVIALLADISDFMSLLPGDLLVIGTPGNAPLARHGDHVRVTVTGFTCEPDHGGGVFRKRARAMKHLRLVHDGRDQWGSLVAGGDRIRLSSGAELPLHDAILLPPITPGARIFALGLNYADHSAELGFKAPDKPLIFSKGVNSLVAHHGVSYRPRGVTQMHPECELVAIIGQTARKVSEAGALNHVGGYTVACDYAIREYLENYYRPNLRVKNRDSLTPIGPWVIDASDVVDPQSLEMTTMIGDRTVQSGTTRDMIFSVAYLVTYLSNMTTLEPGDMILTGTPHGVAFVEGGDEVICEIEQIGRLINHVEQCP